MEWNEHQRAELVRQYARVGYLPGEVWPAPPEWWTADQLSNCSAASPDGAGRAGYVAALADAASLGEGLPNKELSPDGTG
jgi:hypothetical protein